MEAAAALVNLHVSNPGQQAVVSCQVASCLAGAPAAPSVTAVGNQCTKTALLEPPAHFVCPISLDIMIDPVVIETGVTFDRRSIEWWLLRSSCPRCPATNQALRPDARCVPNLAVRCQILDWLQQQGECAQAEAMRDACRQSAAREHVSGRSGMGPQALRSLEARHGAQLVIHNGTRATLHRVWVDYAGRRHCYGELKPGSKTLQPTFQSHAWLLVDGATRRVVAVHVAQSGRQVLKISGAMPHPVVRLA